MKVFTDYTIEDYTCHIDMSQGSSQPSGKITRCGLFRRVNKEAFSNDNVITSYMTDEIMNVPTVTIRR